VNRPASRNKSDRVAEDFVFDPARQMVPEKTSRTLRVSGHAGNPARVYSVRKRDCLH